jgi:hypothetical protein
VLEKGELNSQTFMYIQDGAIHSEDYSLVYEIFPKAEVEWVGFTRTYIHFFPYNKDSKNYRYARTSQGGLVFEGSIYKGRWLMDKSDW